MRGKLMTAAILAIALTTLVLAGCGKKTQVRGPIAMTESEQENWEIALVEARIQKNEQFMSDPESPLPEDQRAGFEGLDYYFPNPALRFDLPLETTGKPDTVMLAKVKGQQVPYVRRGTVSFRYQDHNYRLTVFGPADLSNGDYLWLPFSDPTNADQTYEGGRYLDLTQAPDGSVEVDFNRAYNPLCAYDHERYNCTLPPPENKLPFRVEAGEKRHVIPAEAPPSPEQPATDGDPEAVPSPTTAHAGAATNAG